MTEKRFIQPNEECRVIKNTKTGETAIYYDTEDGLMFLKWLNNLSDENEQLKQRNDRQYNQLKQLWELIEDEDYNTLRSMLNQRETDEKLLQKEWGTYSD